MSSTAIATACSTRALIVGNDKGGIGKDLMAEGLTIGLSDLNQDHQLIEIESMKRLGHIYPHAKFIQAKAVGADQIYANPDSIFEPMDKLATIMAQSPVNVVSLGANLTGAFIEWSTTNGPRHFDDGAGLIFVCVLTMNRAALASGLANLFDFGVQYPAAKRVAILNEFAAPFIDGDRNLAKRLKEAQGDGSPIEPIRITRMIAPAWGYLQNLGGLRDVAAMPAQKLIDLGLPEGPSIRSMAMFSKWLEHDLLVPLGRLLPPAGGESHGQ